MKNNMATCTIVLLTLIALENCKIIPKQKVFYIDTEDTVKEANYYLRVMDSLALSSSDDTIHVCPNCINFMIATTGIHTSGKLTEMGEFDFIKEDLIKWHLWFENKALKKK